MSDIEVGKVVYVRTSDEPVFVIAIDGATALVRRPISAEAGVSHVLDSFGLNELQTKETKTIEDMAFTKFQFDTRDKLARERQEESKQNATQATTALQSDAPEEGYLN